MQRIHCVCAAHFTGLGLWKTHARQLCNRKSSLFLMRSVDMIACVYETERIPGTTTIRTSAIMLGMCRLIRHRHIMYHNYSATHRRKMRKRRERERETERSRPTLRATETEKFRLVCRIHVYN